MKLWSDWVIEREISVGSGDQGWNKGSGWHCKLWWWWWWLVAWGKGAKVWVFVTWMKRGWRHASPQWLSQTQLIHLLSAAKLLLVLTWNAFALTRTLQSYLFLELTQLLPLHFLQSAISLLLLTAKLPSPFSC